VLLDRQGGDEASLRWSDDQDVLGRAELLRVEVYEPYDVLEGGLHRQAVDGVAGCGKVVAEEVEQVGDAQAMGFSRLPRTPEKVPDIPETGHAACRDTRCCQSG